MVGVVVEVVAVDVVVGLDVVVVVFDVVVSGLDVVVVVFDVVVVVDVEDIEVVSVVELEPVVSVGPGPALSLHAMLSAAAHTVDNRGPRDEDTFRMMYVGERYPEPPPMQHLATDDPSHDMPIFRLTS